MPLIYFLSFSFCIFEFKGKFFKFLLNSFVILFLGTDKDNVSNSENIKLRAADTFNNYFHHSSVMPITSRYIT